MAYLNKIPILVIEDEDKHVAQIEKRLGDAYDVEPLKSYDSEQLYNYKALNQDSQIIIVDLVLDTENDVHEGLNAIRDTLWPIDRTTLFIVFSRYIEDKTLPSLNEVEPHWTFVKKEVEGDQCNRKCLDNLYNIVESCRRYSSPRLETPLYDPYTWTDQIDRYVGSSQFGKVSFHNPVRENIIRSVEVLNDLAQAASYYVKAGEQASHLAIVVYGSCGRLEMRNDSDIECSVYYSNSEPSANLAIAFWNRITRHIKMRGFNYEGQQKIEESPTGLLTSTQADELLQNTFYPVINEHYFLNSKLDKHPHVRNRHFQILTEVRPIFNPDFIFDMKRKMISRYTKRSSNLAAIVRSQYVVNVVTQFSMDTAPETLIEWGDLKRFCYRTLSVWSLRIALIGRLRFGDENLKNYRDWQGFFGLLLDPGIIKVVKFANDCNEHVQASDTEKEMLIDRLGEFIETYFRITSRFTTGSKNPDELKRDVRLAANHYVDTLEQLKQMRYFRSLLEDIPWLFSIGTILDDLRRRF